MDGEFAFSVGAPMTSTNPPDDTNGDRADHRDLLARFAALSDDYRFTKDDAALVSAALRGRNFSYATTGSSPEGQVLIDGFTAFDQRFHTAGELRRLLRENPPPKNKSPFLKDSEVHSNTIMEAAHMRVRFRALLELLQEKGVITDVEYSASYERILNRDFAAFMHGFILTDTAFGNIHGAWYDEQQRVYGNRPQIPLPPIPQVPEDAGEDDTQ
jgi:hypothetical protein